MVLEGDPRFSSRVGFGPAVDLGFREPSPRIRDAAFPVAGSSAYEPWMGTFAFGEHDRVGRARRSGRVRR